VLVLEDVVTTGGSVREVIELVRKHGGQVVGVAALVDRSNGQVDFGVPFQALISLDVASYDPDDCPLCRQGIPAVKPGSRR
jgi:orotate phosphoribosyltransferase